MEKTQNILVYGHRGAAGEAPENTIAGCRHAIDRGVRYIELDLRLTKDRQLVVIHDVSVDRTTAQKGKVERYNASELIIMRATRSERPGWINLKCLGVSTLDAVMDATPEILYFQLEVKGAASSQMKLVAELLTERFSTAYFAERIVVTSSNLSFLKILMRMAPHIPRGYMSITSQPSAILELYKCSLLAIKWSVYNHRNLGSSCKANIHVSVWTVNDASVIKKLHQSKTVDNIITDYPSMALPLIASLERFGEYKNIICENE